jgi:putative transposase
VPKKIRVDNGPELTSVALYQWACWNEVQLVFSRPAIPTDNTHTEYFKARLRRECLIARSFESIEEARSKIKTWWHQYNEEHPHSALGYLTPNVFAKKTMLIRLKNTAPLSSYVVLKWEAARVW